MSVLKFENISKTYNPGLFKKKVQAVRDLSLSVEEGEVFGLIGPNGAGKSTTIRLLLGLIRPDCGTITFQGKALHEAHIQKKTGYLPENPYLYDHLTLRELLRFCASTSSMDSAVRDRRIDELLGQLAMTAAANRQLRTFSKGMLQRAGICFALLHDPAVVILDEPMSGLDPLGRKMVFDLVMDLKGQGKTIFFCSHILSDVERLCDRIGILVGGQMVREFSREQFEDRQETPIHLLLGHLSSEQRNLLNELPCAVGEEPEGVLLSVASADLEGVSGRLAQAGLSVLSSRSQRVSLESVFLQAVKEQQS